jgi:hypothetical protein
MDFILFSCHAECERGPCAVKQQSTVPGASVSCTWHERSSEGCSGATSSSTTSPVSGTKVRKKCAPDDVIVIRYADDNDIGWFSKSEEEPLSLRPRQTSTFFQLQFEEGWAGKRRIKYGQRALAETAMGRYKAIIGPCLRARSFSGQEGRSGCRHGRPQSNARRGRPDSVRRLNIAA